MNAINEINTAITQAAQNNNLRALFGGDSPAVSVSQDIAEQLGLDADFVRKNAGNAQLDAILNMAKQAEADNIATQLNSLALSIGGEEALELMGISDSEEFNLDLAIERLSGQVNNPQAQQLAFLLSYVKYMKGKMSLSTVGVDDNQVLDFSVTGLTVPMSKTDEWYQSLMQDQFGFGIDGMTDLRKISIGDSMMKMIMEDGVSAWLDRNNISTILGMSSVVEGLPQLMHMQKVLEEAGLGLSDLLNENIDEETYDKIDAALQKAGFSAKAAVSAIEDVNDALFYDGLRATEAYGESTEDVISLMQQMEDGAKGAADAFKSLASAMSSAQNIQML